jgi:hypothetical protein
VPSVPPILRGNADRTVEGDATMGGSHGQARTSAKADRLAAIFLSLWINWYLRKPLGGETNAFSERRQIAPFAFAFDDIMPIATHCADKHKVVRQIEIFDVHPVAIAWSVGRRPQIGPQHPAKIRSTVTTVTEYGLSSSVNISNFKSGPYIGAHAAKRHHVGNEEIRLIHDFAIGLKDCLCCLRLLEIQLQYFVVQREKPLKSVLGADALFFQADLAGIGEEYVWPRQVDTQSAAILL